MEQATGKRLLEGFAAHSYAAWKAAAEELLKGRPFAKTLLTPTYEGFDLEPLYTAEHPAALPAPDLPGTGTRVRGSRVEGYLTAGWLVSQELSAPTPEALNAVVLPELAGGQNELNLWLDRPSREGLDADAGAAHGVGECGVSLNSTGDLDELFKGVHLEMVSLYWRSGAAAPALYALLLAWLRGRGVDPRAVRGCLGWDPVGWLAGTGAYPGTEDKVHDVTAALLRHAAGALPRLQVLDVQGHAFHNAGASSSQEMAAVLAAGAACLKAMATRGVPAAQVAPRLRLSLSVGGDYFIEIAKLRAMRQLWSRVLEAFGVPEAQRAVHLHARTGLWNKTVYDPYVNMLRTTAEAFAAVVGGCDSLHVGPFDEVIRESDAFARRIARNTHAILAEECGLQQVIDPAGGAWAVEHLTGQMAAQAWKRFQEIEAAGGITAVLAAGTLQDGIAAVRQKKAAAIQRRKDLLVGTNAYPLAGETPLAAPPADPAAVAQARRAKVRAWDAGRDKATVKAALAAAAAAAGVERIEGLVAAAAAGATLGELHRATGLGANGPAAEPLRLRRAAEEYEALRRAAAALKAAGKDPRVHQLNMGPSRRYRIRADWTSAFFQVGGLEVLNADDYADPPAAVAALAASKARIAVITSDDEAYAAVVEPLARALKEQDPGLLLLLAGAPGDHEAAWRAAGVDDFVNVRVNPHAFNRGLLERLGARF